MFTCCIRYNIDPDKLAAFREYARAWISLINKYRGLHHGYFIPGTARDNLPIAAFSFPGLGIEGPPKRRRRHIHLSKFRDIWTLPYGRF